jgi:hypothetical protein
MKRRILLRVAYGGAACLALVACGLLVLYWFDPFRAKPFEKVAWAKANAYGRAAMTRDAIRHLPAGLLESEIEPLLGKSGEVIETHRLTKRAPSGAVRTYSYYLGSWSLAAYDDTFLWIHVGDDGRVIEAEIGGG